ncbi:selenocysteine-specific translation elongation factor [Avibacterium paragallinarum]|uniref:selenocysteine-specific translation elongation factor n=1 Tax=Avibacterium paragallinarum TaxID=728 RepID=UPI00021ACE9A|nr:selenocysteine-specific translation elongation factor [Avibacterium paragallinarum]AZI15102.1 selenocysteine-specific translation elongation factor [Avibacterium paragallinarum]QJE10510.1 selenocysteine-specific translation elongation factor [Avibacterium paragallinarum]QJE12703.1 selenocysteine-specific translation elongation factor [Avibacterium paragallinarum]QJE14905.1 selenocysteine-specific translation elongation factor [Avibacterium paragallinarum]QJE17104.1 selenocysteine-specific t
MIIVTSGHVDHGKTALLQSLTGQNADRLPEEKKRGMTIDLGYAYLPLKDKSLGFIDVPGHEKFLSNMLAGLGGVHYAMLIIAADEGIQPQTQEHLAILRLLQFEQIIVVISKADNAENAQISQLKQQITQQYPFLTDSPFFITSARTGQGIAELQDYLAHLPERAERDRPFRYAIDRIFSLKGVGTVVTGTAFSGQVAVDDVLYLSTGQKVRIKNIHSQDQQANEGFAGQRLALNIQTEVERNAIQRGDWLFAQPPLPPTDRLTIDVEAENLLQESQSVHIYHAAARTTGKLTLLQHKQCYPQQNALAELVLEQPLFLTDGDKLILRSGDAKNLVGGARVIEIRSPKRYKRTEVRLDFLHNLQQANTTAERLACYLQQRPMPLAELAWLSQCSATQLTALLTQIHAHSWQNWAFNAEYAQTQQANLLQTLADYHQQHADQLGLSKARLYRIAAIKQPEALIYHFIDTLLAQDKIQQTRGWLHLPEHKIRFTPQEQALWQDVLCHFEQQQGQALWVRDLANLLEMEESEMRNFLYKAGKLGYLTPIVRDRFILSETLYGYARWIKAFIEQNGQISVNQLRDQLQWGRKMTVQLMEYLDRCGFLRRKGNVHLLRDGELFDL